MDKIGAYWVRRGRCDGSVSQSCARTEMPNIHDTTTGSSESSSEYLHNTGCKIKYSESGGRRVYGALSAVYHMEHEIESEAQFSAASRAIPAHTLLESSPALLFSAGEYEAHGRHTVLDRHSFRWTDGRMALALGLGGISDGPLTLSNYFRCRLSLQPLRRSERFVLDRYVHGVHPIHDHTGSRA